MIKGKAVLLKVSGEDKGEFSDLVGTESLLEIGNRESRFHPDLVMRKKRVLVKGKTVKVFTLLNNTFTFELV